MQTELAEIVKNIFKRPLLRYTFIISTAISVFLPAYGHFMIYPEFQNQLKDYAKDTAMRVATHLKSSIYSHGTTLTAQSITPKVIGDVTSLTKDLKIEKIKIFAKSGLVLFSTAPQDIGQKNKHSYFFEHIAKGKTFSKIVDEQDMTMEGRKVTSKVVETYIPLMAEGEFKGAVEVYYDITESGHKLAAIIQELYTTITIASFLFFSLLLVILFKASRNTLVKEAAEEALIEARSHLEKTVDQRTTALKQTNRSLVHEIEERICTEDSLQKSYDTQRITNRLLQESLRETPLEDILDICLDLVLSLSWLSFESMGCIFLVEENSDTLVMKTQRGFPDELAALCSNVAFGRCLCGRAAETQQPVFSSNIDRRHDILLPGTPDHGHYCVPLTANKKTLGVINIYVKPGHNKDDMELAFLEAVANTLSGILIRRRGEQQQREIEQRLSHSHKMEAIGTLASGIAHDFNNILSGIMGHAQLTSMNLDKAEKANQHIDQIHKGAKRATELIQQILTFSRQTAHDKKPVRLSPIVKETLKFIRSSFPANIKIVEQITSKSKVKADPTQMHQVLMNLCTNAFHAMRQTGGTLCVNLSEIRYNQDVGSPVIPETRGDLFMLLEVSDTGHGIPKDIQNKIFEPYFTTKKPGDGTGLGLAVVLGIVEDHSGWINVKSDPERGTNIQVYLPVFGDNVETEETEEQIDVQGGTECIMVVDDESSILDFYSGLLGAYGYRVVTFSDGLSALKAFNKNPGAYDILITDMTMPEMTGDILAREILKLKKRFPIILSTGIHDRISKADALKAGIAEYLPKPLEGKKLLSTIRNLLDH